MTQDEFIEKHGNKKVKLFWYYKYEFCFRAELEDGNFLYLYYGGHAEDIYRFRIVVDREYKVSDIGYNCRMGVLSDPFGEDIESFYERY